MDTSKLLPLENRFQIISAIEKGASFGGNIWQTGQSERQMLHISQVLLDIKTDKLIIRTFGLIDLVQKHPIFIRLSYRSILFRLDPGEFKIIGDKLICNYPKEARALEERIGDRYVLPFSADISLSLKRTERNLRETVLDLEVRIVDVSEKGFGILISGANRDFLKSFDHFWIKAIDQRPLNHHIFGTVTYIAPKGYYLKRGDVRVGLSLERALNAEFFEYLKRKACMTLSA